MSVHGNKMILLQSFAKQINLWVDMSLTANKFYMEKIKATNPILQNGRKWMHALNVIE